MKIGVLLAMDAEYEAMSQMDFDVPGKKVVTKVTGIGKVNAAMAATELILKEKPDYIVSSGCAGGMLPGQKVSDFVIASATAYHDVWCGEPNKIGQVQGRPLYFNADPHMLDAAVRTARSYDHPVQLGLIVTGDQFFISTEEDRRILAVHPEALAADMESAAAAQVCANYGVPFISLRIISDIHTSDEVQKETYAGFWDNLRQIRFRFLKEFINNL
ncbi:MAG: 5'-methylthioadenosine/S-adenosylhomocysteine nucleosidase [Bacteroidia bacterium]|nr:5'-methylthioadenosine/S-adenosylhomocysteine nucleosidase [Bacteroidia bacterium]